ncbi:uncharacterized membrane protein YkvA (DUF1232 family) [Agromyces sp. 3263]|uniref:YkvA family protein n=1 Tax=Agromyces sp. 3263 TaxID=2817750 RepID=UPI0028577EB8|nr:YkvA family protein [Agromyces sp. 3263]MDR6905852.1 uncharacterized membrane protein YkvA (DUF1232 family) [Agromyces sp. 3263]
MSAMPTWLEILLGVVGGLVLLWGALIIALVIQYRRTGRSIDWREVARLAPDVVRLITRLAKDRTVPRGTRWWLIGLLAYLLMPIDLVPDFIPVIGYLDDAIIVAVALRFAVKHAGVEALQRNWPGTPAGLAGLLAITGAKPRGGSAGA